MSDEEGVVNAAIDAFCKKRKEMVDKIYALNENDPRFSIIEAVLEGQFHKIEGAVWLYEVDTLLDTPCPTCGGTGEVDNPAIKGGRSSYDAPPAQCPDCEGTGRLL